MGAVEPELARRYARRGCSDTCITDTRDAGHFATLTTTLDQGSDHTKVTWSLAGVPLGMEDEITRNINGY